MSTQGIQQIQADFLSFNSPKQLKQSKHKIGRPAQRQPIKALIIDSYKRLAMQLIIMSKTYHRSRWDFTSIPPPPVEKDDPYL